MSEAETVPLLKCPNCGADDSFTSWELTSMAYHGVRFFVSPVGSGRDVDYDGVYDTESGDGGEFDNDITCRNCDTMNLTIESLLDSDGKPAEPSVNKTTDRSDLRATVDRIASEVKVHGEEEERLSEAAERGDISYERSDSARSDIWAKDSELLAELLGAIASSGILTEAQS
jgi:hypothetical protein